MNKKDYKGYELIKAIYDKEIKGGTRIEVHSLKVADNIITVIEYSNKRLEWGTGEFDTSYLFDDDYYFRVLEDNTKEIEELKEKNKKLEIRFVLDAPHTDYQSDINTLILRIDKLVKFYDNISNDIAQSNMDVDINNKNVECIQEILEHFKFKEC